MDNLTYSIQKRTQQSERLTESWLKQNGIAPNTLVDTNVCLLQAQKIATHLLKEYGKYLGKNEASILNNFICAMRNGKKRKKLKEAQVYKVMNIGKQVNRKIFKAKQNANKSLRSE